MATFLPSSLWRSWVWLLCASPPCGSDFDMGPLIDACKFAYVNPLIADLFPLEAVRGPMGIKHYPGYTSTKEVLADFEKMGVLPMNATELFTYCQNHKDFQGWLMALGSTAEFGGTTRSAGVFSHGWEQRTTLGWLDQMWHDCYSFGYVVPKVS